MIRKNGHRRQALWINMFSKLCKNTTHLSVCTSNISTNMMVCNCLCIVCFNNRLSLVSAMVITRPLGKVIGIYPRSLGRHQIRLIHMGQLIHWGRATHICVGKLIIIGSDNGLSPGRRQAIIWTNAGILLIGPRRINFSEILSEIHSFSFKKMHLKMSSAKWRPFVLASMC